MAADEKALFAFFEALGIASVTRRHPPLHTVEEAKARRGDLPGGHAKTLLLKDKRDRYLLAVVDEDRQVDLRRLAERTGLGRLSFASAERLEAELGVRPGAVTPFALINRRDRPADGFTVVLDAELMARRPLNFHPLHNAATTAVEPEALLRFIAACGYQPKILDFEG